MSYPDPISATNIGNTKDLLDYFKGCLSNYALHERTEDYDDRWVSFIVLLDSLPALPMSRATFYNSIRTHFPTINGQYIYDYPQTDSGWSVKMVRDWGKLKVIEQALFGNTTGAAGNSMASVNGTKFLASIPKWTSASITYLRMGLCRFTTYGTGIVSYSQATPPTNPITNVSARTFNWTNAPGYPNVSDYEYAYPEDNAFKTVTQKPIQIPGNLTLGYNDLLVRTKANGYLLSSNSIGNEQLVPEFSVLISYNQVLFKSTLPTAYNIIWSLSEVLFADSTIFYILRYNYMGEERGQYDSASLIGGSLNPQTGFKPFHDFVGEGAANQPTNYRVEIVSIQPNPVGGKYVSWVNA